MCDMICYMKSKFKILKSYTFLGVAFHNSDPKNYAN